MSKGWLAAGILGTALAGCGGGPGAADASMDADAAFPLSCLERMLIEQGVASFEECGICIGEHARAFSPFVYVVDFVATPRPDGIVITVDAPRIPGLAFVGIGGAGSRLTGDTLVGEWPQVDTIPFYGSAGAFAVPIDGSDRVWVNNRIGRPGDDWYSDVVMYRVSEQERWTRQPWAIRVGRIEHAVALGDGSLIGDEVRLYLIDPEKPRALVKLTPLPDETVSVLRVPLADLGIQRFVEALWRLDGGRIAVVSSDYVSNGGMETQLVIVDGNLAAVGTPLSLTGDPFDPAYVSGQAPRFDEVETFSDGFRFLLLKGALDVLPEPAAYAHGWGFWMDPAGNFSSPPPGVLLNEDFYQTTATSATRSPTAVQIGGGRVRINVATDAPGELTQIVERSGAFVLTEPRNMERPCLPAVDGSDRAYDLCLEDRAYVVSQIDDLGSPVWSTTITSCPAVSISDLDIVGATNGGVWAFFEERLLDRDGFYATVAKVVLLNPDGSFAWQAP